MYEAACNSGNTTMAKHVNNFLFRYIMNVSIRINLYMGLALMEMHTDPLARLRPKLPHARLLEAICCDCAIARITLNQSRATDQGGMAAQHTHTRVNDHRVDARLASLAALEEKPVELQALHHRSTRFGLEASTSTVQQTPIYVAPPETPVAKRVEILERREGRGKWAK